VAAVGLVLGDRVALPTLELADSEVAARVVDRLREAGILIGRTGKREDVLKIRPPLVFDEEHSAILVDALRGAL